MKGSRVGVEGRPTTVFVYEYVTGGGRLGLFMPRSWATEGAAMRRAIVEDFAAVPGVRVVTTVDPRVPFEPPPGVEVRVVTEPDHRMLNVEADATVLIAPETYGLLASLTRSVEQAGGRSLGSEVGAIDLTADKSELAAHFNREGIPTPPTRLISPSKGLPTEWGSPIVVKLVDGAGSIDTFVVPDPAHPALPIRRMLQAVAQPFVPGVVGSASVLVDVDGRATLVGVASQRTVFDPDGRLHYQGGSIGGTGRLALEPIERAVASIPGLRGFVGVDFIESPSGSPTILEINPRPTTSYVGLARLFPPGTIAAAWLESADRGLEATTWPARFKALRDSCRSTIEFDADGTTRDSRETRG